MELFYFYLRMSDRLILDEEGEELPSLSAAQRKALQTTRELLADAIKNGNQDVPDALVIADEAGRALETMPLAAVLPASLRL
jgi:hypothetical protein